ncbi:MAG: PAS domain S-box protein [Chloroflexi bacterium]|nr:PAS domain S-box protein [Chloroflexota bacterium]MCI0579280.1 PAS domain S-box protein [Chloroflexota bacterium]MCI0644360.1 PAS domain S-box protein [Chloroflexota bacterium]MCI0728023.1 PAS domain S-box protein [Chloroflexota bacterium]
MAPQRDVLKRKRRKRKTREVALQESEERYRKLVQHSIEAIYLYDPDTRQLLEANPAFCRMLGYTDEEARRLTIYDFVAHGRGEVDAFLTQVVEQGAITLGERLWRRKDGSLVSVHVTVSKIRHTNRNILFVIGSDITERKQAELSLRQAEERYRSLFEEAPVMYVITHNREDAPIIADCNKLFLHTLGYQRSEVVGRPLADFYTPRSRVQLLEKGGYRAALQEGLSDQERELVTQDGRVIETLLQAIPVINVDGQIVGTRAAFVDISERRQREREAETLRQVAQAISSTLHLEEVLALIARQLAMAVGVASCTLSRWDRAAEIVVTWVEWHQSEVMPLEATIFPLQAYPTTRFVLETGQPAIIHITDPGADEAEVALIQEVGYNTLLMLPLAVGERVVGLVELANDLHRDFTAADIRLCQALANQAAVAIENARLFEAAHRHAEEMKVTSAILHALNAVPDIHTSFPAVAGGLMAITGCERVALALLEENGDWFSVVALDRRRTGLSEGVRFPLSVTAAAAAVLVGQTHLTPDLSAELDFPAERALYEAGYRSRVNLPLQVKDWVIGALSLNWSRPRGYQEEQLTLLNQIAGAVAVTVEKGRLYEQLHAHAAQLEKRVAERTQELAGANERLTELDRLKSKFISDISHELRTPVTNLHLYLRLLEKGDYERREWYLDVLKKETGRLQSFIEDILELSRVEMGHSRRQLVPVDLNRLATQVVAMHQPRAEAAGLCLIFKPAPGLPPLRSEPNQLTQIVTNLLVNAINYTPAGTIEVSTRLDQSGQQLCLVVADTGMGIPAEDLPHLFDRFYRGQQAAQSNIPGTGLGLSIVKEIVELHGGRIEVESVLGIGSTFTAIFKPE